MATARDLKPVPYEGLEGPATTTLISGIVSDVGDLVRKEIALARQETVEELQKAKTAGIALAISGVVLALGGMLLLLAGAQALADLLDWPAWAGYGSIGLLLALVGGVLLATAQKRFKQVHPIPEKTAETMKENVAWLKERTTGKT